MVERLKLKEMVMGQQRRSYDICDEPGLPPTPDILRRGSELTLRAITRLSLRKKARRPSLHNLR
jgi:hypothetical protein